MVNTKVLPSPFDPCLSINNEAIRFIGEDSFKDLGRHIQASLSDKNAFESTLDSFTSNLEKVDDSPISGASKAWIYQFMVVSFLIWPFLVYPFAKSEVVKHFDALASKYLKKWYGLHKSFNPDILYLPKSNNGWNLSAPSTVFMSIQVTAQQILKYSVDELTSSLAAYSRRSASKSRSNKWKPEVMADHLETVLAFNINFGGHTSDRVWVVAFTKTCTMRHLNRNVNRLLFSVNKRLQRKN